MCLYIYVYIHIHTYIHTCMHPSIHTYIHTYIHIYIYTHMHGYTLFHRPQPVSSSSTFYTYMHGHTLFHRPQPVSSSSTFQRCCAHVRDVVHVSQELCRFHSSCARFTSPLVTVLGDQTKFSDIHIHTVTYIYTQLHNTYTYSYIHVVDTHT